MPTTVDVRSGAYHDSVTLMRVSRAVAAADGVDAALVAMGTELNLDLLDGMGFARPDAGPGDLVVAIRAADDERLDAALATLESALADIGRRTGDAGAAAAAPRTLRSAATALDGGGVALISVPGRHALPEVMDALDAGLHVMLFSDNVPVEHEIAAKDAAAERGLLVMGPDCGTAAIGGVGLGFSNATRPGSVGIVAASGTGAQQLMCLLDAAGAGVSHVIGVGGRDLSADVGGRSALRAIAALGADPATDVVVVVSKPPAPEVAERVRAAADALGTPVVMALLGPGQDDLTTAAERALATVGVAAPDWPVLRPERAAEPAQGALRGLFSGGTLCDEAMVLVGETLGPIRSNIPLDPALALPPDLRADGHLMIDFGDDRLTAGRPHPMVDGTLRLERLAAEAADPQVAVVLLDVVLGYGAHPDPASELAPALTAARATAAGGGRDLAVVVSLCGTAEDPQGFDRQAGALAAAGAEIYLSNAAAARRAADLAKGASA